MIAQDTYKLIQKYAKKFAKSPNDIEDITQESCYLLLKNPTDGVPPKRFYFVLAKRGAYRYYFNTNTKELLNKDQILNDAEYNELVSKMKSDSNVEQEYAYSEIKSLLKDIPVKNHSHFSSGITKTEFQLLIKILNSYEPQYEDRTHFNNLTKKLIAYFS